MKRVTKLPSICEKTIIHETKHSIIEVRFADHDFTGENLLIKALQFLTSGRLTELEVKLSQGVTSTKESKRHNKKD